MPAASQDSIQFHMVSHCSAIKAIAFKLQKHTPNQCSYQVSATTPYGFQGTAWTRFKGQDHYSKVNVKSRLQYDVAHLHTITNVPVVSLIYISDKISKVKVTTARSNKDHIIMLHTYIS